MPAIDVSPASLDLTLYAGDGFSARINFIEQSTGDPWPVPGVWEAQVRATELSTEILATFAVDTSDSALGSIVISLTGDDTRDLVGTTAFWDLQQTPSGGEPRTWYKGKVRTSQDVTR